jgi:hypothetical protein
MPVVISQHLLNVFVQLANKRGLKKTINVGGGIRTSIPPPFTVSTLITISGRKFLSVKVYQSYELTVYGFMYRGNLDLITTSSPISAALERG